MNPVNGEENSSDLRILTVSIPQWNYQCSVLNFTVSFLGYVIYEVHLNSGTSEEGDRPAHLSKSLERKRYRRRSQPQCITPFPQQPMNPQAGSLLEVSCVFGIKSPIESGFDQVVGHGGVAPSNSSSPLRPRCPSCPCLYDLAKFSNSQHKDRGLARAKPLSLCETCQVLLRGHQDRRCCF